MIPRELFGLLRCGSCRVSLMSAWATAAPFLMCEDCGGYLVPVGTQVPFIDTLPAIDGEMIRIERAQMRRLKS
jgi:hypothetical protein